MVTTVFLEGLVGYFLETTKSPTREYEEDVRSDSAARVGGPDPGVPNYHVRPTSGRVRVSGCPLWQRDWQRWGGGVCPRLRTPGTRMHPPYLSGSSGACVGHTQRVFGGRQMNAT